MEVSIINYFIEWCRGRGGGGGGWGVKLNTVCELMKDGISNWKISKDIYTVVGNAENWQS